MWFADRDDRIFISYRRAGTAAFAGRLRDRLDVLFPDCVFLDVDNIEPGADFVHKIDRTIGSSKVLILLVGTGWLSNATGTAKLGDENDIVTLEILSALKRGVPIIPVLIDGAEFPTEDSLPPNLRPLTRINALQIRHADFEHGVSQIAKPIYGYLGRKPPTSLELFLESLAPRFFFRGFRYDEKQRAFHAFISLFLMILVATATGMLIAQYILTEQPMLMEMLSVMAYCVLSAFPGLIGLNSARYRKLAIVALIVAGLCFAVVFVLFDYEAILGSEKRHLRALGIS